jgi:hypothetical protein
MTPDTTYDALYARRHPEYQDSVAHWDFCEETYRGGREWFEKHLHTYQKEGEKEFAERKKRASRFNHTREAVDLVQKYLFKADIQRDVEGAPDAVKVFWKRATRNGMGISELVRTSSTKNSVLGRVAVVVDNNLRNRVDTTDNAVLSQADVEEAGFSIYAYVVKPQNILDFAFDEDGDGELIWVRLREFVRDDKDPFDSSGNVIERQRLWTRSNWYVFDRPTTSYNQKQEPVRLVDRGFHGLGMVPVYLDDHSVSDSKYVPPSLVDDIAYLDRTIANYLSNLDAIIQDQTFSQLAIPAQALTGDQTKQKDNIIEMGTKRIFTYDGGSGSNAKPEFISPDPKQAGVILDVINKHINEIYHTIGLAGERTKQDNSVGIDNSSGVAKAYDFERVNSLLMSKAKRCERLENWLVKAVLAWAGEKPPAEDLVTYPETFDVAGLGDELVVAEALAKVNAPEEMRKQQMLSILDKLFPQVTEERYAELKKAVKDWEVNPPVPEKPASTIKPVAAPNRQGSVTPDTKK